MRGAVGHAEWLGVRLSDVLEEARLQSGAAPRSPDRRRCTAVAQDARVHPQHPTRPSPWTRIHVARSVHERRAASRHTRRPFASGCAGWAGNNWIKWLRRIVVAREGGAWLLHANGLSTSQVAFAARCDAETGRPAAGHVAEREVSDHLA